jgi:hypothetical protein
MRKQGLVILAFLGLVLGLAGPASAQCLGLGGANYTPQLGVTCSLPLTQASVAVVGTVGGPTQVVAAVAGQKIYVTSINMVGAATATIALTYGTGTNCATGNTALTGTITITTAGAGLTVGDGNGALLIVPAGNALCTTIGTAVAPGWIAYAQF